MSQKLGKGVGLNETPDNMFGKTMALADAGVIQTFIDCTRLSLVEIEEKKKRLEAGENPRDIKLELAHEIVQMYHDKESADQAQENWLKTFSQKEMPTDIQEFQPSAYDIITVLIGSGLAESKSEAKRAIEQNGVKVNGEVITDFNLTLKSGDTVQKGKRFFVRVK